MHELFKYIMNTLRTRLILEWQDLHITYPKWASTVVMDETYYIATMTLVCATCFAVGLVIGTVVTVV